MKINPNLITLYEAYKQSKHVILEGGSRSGKTWSVIDFIIWYSATNNNKTINIIRRHHSTFKTTLYEDFNRRLPMFGIRSPFAGRQEVRAFFLRTNKVNFLSADDSDKLHGSGADLVWYNEAIDIPKTVFDQTEQRCRGIWVMDYNPKFIQHWIYALQRRNDIMVRHSTWLDNPGISDTELKKIRSYEPTPENIQAGTADDYLWRVYGLGQKAAPTGQIFKHINWIDVFPQDIENIFFGLDFGFTNSPSALVKCGIRAGDLFLELLFYAPTETSDLLIPVLEQTKGFTVWADPSGRGMITDLRRAGFNVLAANTFPGSIKYGISLIKKFRINIVRNEDAMKEAENYRYKEVNSIMRDDPIILDDPIDDFNHFWDAVRMAVMMHVPRL